MGWLKKIFSGSQVETGYDKGLYAHQAGDYATAIAEFTPLAEAGHVSSQFILGAMYAEGRGVGKSEEEAVKWYRLAADAGLDEAQFSLGAMYANGLGVAQNDVEAVKWYRLAAEAGHDTAQCNLGFMYASGKGVTQDNVAAEKWYRLSAEAGNADGQCNMGVMYAHGKGVAQDINFAYIWFSLAADQEHKEAGKALKKIAKRMPPEQISEAQFIMGLMCAEGLSIPQNDVEAVKWYRLAAEAGNADAQYNLGVMYARGKGVSCGILKKR